MPASVTLTNLGKSFGATAALTDVTAAIGAGQITGLVGPDGAGKTTLLRLIAGLLTPDKGTLEILGHTATDRDAVRGDIGYMPQRFGLYEDLTVQENLNLQADLHDLDEAARSERFATLLQFTGLVPFTRRLAGQLSGGMKQKLGLACALLPRPKLLLLDEPSAGVDPASRWRAPASPSSGAPPISTRPSAATASSCSMAAVSSLPAIPRTSRSGWRGAPS
jgi:ABC-2 type transport system ATP-binding protein